MREQAEQAPKTTYLDGVASALLQSSRRLLWHFKRKFGRTDTGIIERYFSSHKTGNYILDVVATCSMAGSMQTSFLGRRWSFIWTQRNHFLRR